MPQNYPTSLHLGWEGPAPQQGRGFAIKETAAQGEGLSCGAPQGGSSGCPGRQALVLGRHHRLRDSPGKRGI